MKIPVPKNLLIACLMPVFSLNFTIATACAESISSADTQKIIDRLDNIEKKMNSIQTTRPSNLSIVFAPGCKSDEECRKIGAAVCADMGYKQNRRYAGADGAIGTFVCYD